MRPPSPSTVTLILGVLTVGAALLGHWLSRRGKRDEIRQQQVAQAFEERNVAYEQVSALADRYKHDADRERELHRQDVATWEKRWARQMDRCRAITDSLSAAIGRLQQDASPAMKADAEHARQELRDHDDEDHPQG